MAPWRNGSVSVLHAEGSGSIPLGATMIIEIKHIINKKTSEVLCPIIRMRLVTEYDKKTVTPDWKMWSIIEKLANIKVIH